MGSAGIVREIFEDWQVTHHIFVVLEILSFLEFGDCGQIFVIVTEHPDFWKVVFSIPEDMNSF